MKYSRDQIINYINSYLTNLLLSNSFLKQVEDAEIRFKRQYAWGGDEFSFSRIAFLETHIEFGIDISRRYNFIEEIWQEWSTFINEPTSENSPTIYVRVENCSEEIKRKSYYSRILRFEITDKGLAKIPEAIDFVMSKIFEKMNLLLDINELDKHVNTQFQFNEDLHSIFYWPGLMYKRIAIAKFANNPNYEALCDFMRKDFDWYNENGKIEGQEYFLNYPIVFEKVYERLKNIEPLKNTILSDKAV